MKVAIVGAGIVGVTTALALAESGHDVTVFEANGTVAEETSFANAGVMAPGYVTPWAAPGMPLKVAKQLFSRNAAVRWQPRLERDQAQWLWRWLRACKRERYLANRNAMQQLALASLDKLKSWRSQYALEYEQQQGYLQLLRSAAELQQVQASLDTLKSLGVAHQLVDAARCYELEPSLNTHTALHAAVHLPNDEVGNCRLFALQARQVAESLGVQFVFRAHVADIEPAKRCVELRVASVTNPTETSSDQFDAVVVCAGLASKTLLKPLGLDVPLLPVWGYSLSAPLQDSALGPRSGIMDERYKTSITRLGLRVRVAGTAEIGAKPGAINQSALGTLYDVLRDWYPSSARIGKAQVWMGGRPMLPEGAPLLGATAHAGLYVNIGHGSSGWALACGSAQYIAETLAGKRPTVIVKSSSLAEAAYSVARYA